MFGAVAHDTDMVGEPSSCRVEGVAGGDIDVFVCVIGGVITAGHQLRAGHAQIYVNLEEVALMPVPVPALDHHAARGNAVENLFELGGLTPNPRLERW
jgi:hypothetical protein